MRSNINEIKHLTRNEIFVDETRKKMSLDSHYDAGYPTNNAQYTMQENPYATHSAYFPPAPTSASFFSPYASYMNSGPNTATANYHPNAHMSQMHVPRPEDVLPMTALSYPPAYQRTERDTLMSPHTSNYYQARSASTSGCFDNNCVGCGAPLH